MTCMDIDKEKFFSKQNNSKLKIKKDGETSFVYHR